MAGADLPQQLFSQVVFDTGACHLGWLGDCQPQLAFGHRGHQITVLDRAGQLRIVGAARLEVSAYSQDDQGCGFVVGAVPDGGRSVQRGDECAPLLLIGTLGKQLLELVNHQQQPGALPRAGCLVSRRTARLRHTGLARGQRETSRIDVQPSPYCGRVRPCQLRHPDGQFLQWRPSRGEQQARPGSRLRRGHQPSSPHPRKHTRPQQRRFPCS